MDKDVPGPRRRAADGGGPGLGYAGRMIAVQHIAIHWTKWDRGPAAGARFKAVPRQLPFAPPGDVVGDWVHHVRYDSQREPSYAMREAWSARRPVADDGVTIRTVGDVAEVHFAAGHVYQGKVHREHFTGLVARLPFGQRLVIRVNGASDGDHQRYYSEHTIHIGFADTATLDLPLFRDIDERVPLY